jgi:transposase
MAREPKTSRREVPLRKRAIILDHYRQGKSIPEIRAAIKLPRSTIRSIIDRYKNEEDPIFENEPRSGRPLELDSRAERRLLRHASANTKDTLYTLATLGSKGSVVLICPRRKIKTVRWENRYK